MQCSSHRISMPTIAGQHGAMIVLAGLLAAAAADDCCWFARSPKGATFEKPRQAIAACDTKHLCFVACSAARRRVAQTYYKDRIAPKACTCDPNIIAREAKLLLPTKNARVAEPAGRLRGCVPRALQSRGAASTGGASPASRWTP